MGFSLGPLEIWLELGDLRNQIASASVKHSLAQHRLLPTANPEVWFQ
jgi:hypothetical protein